MLLFWIAAAAQAADWRVVSTHTEDKLAMEWLEVSEEGEWAASFAGEQVILLDAQTWSTRALDVCSGAQSMTFGLGQEPVLYVGCGDGSLGRVTLSGRVPVVQELIPLSETELLGLAAGETTLYGVSSAESGLQVHTMDVESLQVDQEDSFPASISTAGLEDVELIPGYLLLLHGSDDLSKMDLSTGSAARSTENLGGRDFIDFSTDGNSVILIADSRGAVLRYNLGANEYSILLDDEDGLTSSTALSLRHEQESPFLALAANDEIWGLDYQDGGVSDSPSWILDQSADWLEGLGDVLLLVDGGGSLQVLSDRAWGSITPDDAIYTLGDSVTLTLQADQGGDWKLRLGSAEGELLAEGSLAAGEAAEGQFTIDDRFREGSNRVFLTLDSQALDAEDLEIDSPPSAVELGADDVGFSDQSILLHIPAVEDADLSHYLVYLSTEAWSPEDYSTGGPAYVGPDAETWSSATVVQAEGGVDVDLVLSPVQNGISYFVAVRAVDAGDKEGPMSEVIEVIPQETLSAAQLAGEAGGCGCSSSPRAPWGGLALLSVVAWRRRRGSGLALAAMLASLVPSVAQAERWHQHQGTNMELRAGPLDLADPNDSIRSVYGDRSYTSLMWEKGPQLWRVLEVDIGAGWMRRQGELVGALDGESSTEQGQLTLLPFTAGVSARLAVAENQWVVPFLRGGGDYWLWMEQVDTGEGFLQGDRMSGGKAGWHWGWGLDILLDPLDRSRADLAQARWGIQNTFLVLEFREQAMLDGNEGLDFGGSQMSVGLKIDR